MRLCIFVGTLESQWLFVEEPNLHLLAYVCKSMCFIVSVLFYFIILIQSSFLSALMLTINYLF